MSLTEPQAFLKRKKATEEAADTMSFFPVSTHRGLFHWQGLLLVVLLLNFRSLPTTAQDDIWVKNAGEGQDVLLRILNMPPDVTRLAWYRGKVPDKDHIIAFLSQNPELNVRFPKTGRMILNSDGSLLLKKVILQDSGIYTVEVAQKNSKILVGYAELRVYGLLSRPTLQASSTTVTEKKDAVVFTCYSKALTISWFFNGKKLQPTQRMKLSRDHKKLTIDPVKMGDAGKYQCLASNPINSVISVPLYLNVRLE